MHFILLEMSTYIIYDTNFIKYLHISTYIEFTIIN